jgi:hypothetical protein
VTRYTRFIGIDYSGADIPTARLKGLQVYEAIPGGLPQRVTSPAATKHAPRNWTRQEIAHWLIGLAREGRPFIAGIDHGFSLPDSYLQRHALKNWPQFLDDFCRHWPADGDDVTVESLRLSNRRAGSNTEFRLCERWTSSAKSVFQFDVQGSVAKSTHAGIPWLRHIREAVGDRVHFWPFDGWLPPAGKSVIAEVYPSVFRNRYPKEGRTADEHDAYAVARWLQEMSGRGELGRYWNPPLTAEERGVAEREGWILGVC